MKGSRLHGHLGLHPSPRWEEVWTSILGVVGPTYTLCLKTSTVLDSYQDPQSHSCGWITSPLRGKSETFCLFCQNEAIFCNPKICLRGSRVKWRCGLGFDDGAALLTTNRHFNHVIGNNYLFISTLLIIYLFLFFLHYIICINLINKYIMYRLHTVYKMNIN